MSKLKRAVRKALSNEWFVAITGGVIVTVASAYIVFFAFGGSSGPASLPQRASPRPLHEYVSVDRLAASTRSSFYVSVTGATARFGVSIDIFSAAGQQVSGTFVRSDGKGHATASYPWPVNNDRPQPGIWKIATHDTESGAEVTAYLIVV